MDLNAVHFSYLIIHHPFSIFLETFRNIPTVFSFFFSSYLANVCKVPRLYFNIFLFMYKILGNAILLFCFWNHLCAHNLVLSHFSHVQLFAILWIVAHHAPLPMGFSRQEYWRGLSCPPPEDRPNPGTEPASLMSPALASGFFTTTVTWEAHISP